MVGQLLVLLTPQFIYYVIPIAALLSALVTYGLLARSSELTVMKACGISLYRTALSVVVLSLGFSAVLFSLEQRLMASANRQAEVLDARIRGRQPRTLNLLNRRWVVGPDRVIYYYGNFDPERNEMLGPDDVHARGGPVGAGLRDVRAPGRVREPTGGWASRAGGRTSRPIRRRGPDIDAQPAPGNGIA